jgi:hypothetical protein
MGSKMVKARTWRTHVGGTVVALVVAGVVTLIGAAPASAATVNVACTPAALVNAITAANGTTGTVLNLASKCDYHYSVANNEIDGRNALPVIRTSMTIVGNGATLRYVLVPPENLARAIDVAVGATLTVSNLTIRDFQQSTTAYIGGGAIWNQGTLTLQRVALLNNTTFGNGGAIRNNGTLTVTDSTISGNRAFKGPKSGGTGGAISNGAGTATIRRSTIIGNSAQSAAGGLWAYAKTTVAATLLQGNTTQAATTTASNCGQALTDAGYNRANDATCKFAASSTSQGASTLGLMAEAPANNGGPSSTSALPSTVGTAANAARDAIPAGATDCPATGLTDQRGVSRPSNGACDVGAFEAGAVAIAVTTSDFPQTASPVTVTAKVTPSLVGAPIPKGSVTFTRDTTVLGTVALDANGVASIAKTMPLGYRSLVAEYVGPSSVYRLHQSTTVGVGVSAARHFAGFAAPATAGTASYFSAATTLVVPTVDCTTTPNRQTFFGLLSGTSTAPAATTAHRAGVRVYCTSTGGSIYRAETTVGATPATFATTPGDQLSLTLMEDGATNQARVRNRTLTTSVAATGPGTSLAYKNDTHVYLGVATENVTYSVLPSYTGLSFNGCELSGDLCSKAATAFFDLYQEPTNLVQATHSAYDTGGYALSPATWKATGTVKPATAVAVPAVAGSQTVTKQAATTNPASTDFGGYLRTLTGRTWSATATYVVPTFSCAAAPGGSVSIGLVAAPQTPYKRDGGSVRAALTATCAFDRTLSLTAGGLAVAATDTIFVGQFGSGGNVTTVIRNLTKKTVVRSTTALSSQASVGWGAFRTSSVVMPSFGPITFTSARFNGDSIGWLGSFAYQGQPYDLVEPLYSQKVVAGAVQLAPMPTFSLTFQQG